MTKVNHNLEIVNGLLSRRHSHYDIKPKWVAPREEVERLLAQVLQNVPSAFNSQPVRIAFLTGEDHIKHWEIIEEVLISYLGEERYIQSTKTKLHQAFMSGVGTILFFDDPKVTTELQTAYPTYAHNFPIWAQQVQGSHQFATWVGLETLGFGANLQHYIGMADDRIKALAGVPESWTLVAQMPFGQPQTRPATKDKLPLSETLIVK